MPGEVHYLDIILLGKEYRVACPPEEREALQTAVSFVDEKMHDIAKKTRSNISERIAVMAALNIAHEYLAKKNAPVENEKLLTSESETSLDIATAMRKIKDMETALGSVLTPQEKLL